MLIKQLLLSFAHPDFNQAIIAITRKGWIETGIQISGESIVFRQRRGNMFSSLRREGDHLNLYEVII